jgi:hypothetical protein
MSLARGAALHLQTLAEQVTTIVSVGALGAGNQSPIQAGSALPTPDFEVDQRISW